MKGYLSATNRYEQTTFDLAPWQSSGVLSALLAGFCERYPDAQFVRALAMLVNALGPDRLTIRSEVIELGAGKATTYIYVDTLRRAQQALAQKALYRGEISGTLDTATREAFKRFQQEAGLDATGIPDQATLARLLQ